MALRAIPLAPDSEVEPKLLGVMTQAGMEEHEARRIIDAAKAKDGTSEIADEISCACVVGATYAEVAEILRSEKGPDSAAPLAKASMDICDIILNSESEYEGLLN